MGGSSSTSKDALALFQFLGSAYSATHTTFKIIDLYVVYAVFTALTQVVYMAIVGSFPFNSFLSGVLSCIGTAVLAGFATTACICGFSSIQFGSKFGDHELPWIN
ncbi:dolichyl-diphosphooligosaccharide--protein glycosyltransferase subunit DAD1-like isoform X3 [Ziziphus jujuba]|uniref:Dolichyl-diphosphooligosaccharide--protein glycosyltransferase subunit DAD1 n=1 Tax=Ziziphus jujuba TaxID=326968 RepID=A0ABM4AD27_ZIZJJ|nr:dolichyl-diphosphooligosaccharide--protein glycosyltransferase subunit DAD1-like isoform X3 [Ziziphus jujuba]